MAGINHITAEELAIMQKALGLKLPPDYVRFAATHPLPKLSYLGPDDLDELTGLSARDIIAFNENLRDPGLNPEGWPDLWKEEYFALGCRVHDDGVYYLDLRQNTPISSVYVLETGMPGGQLISGNFTRWAASMLDGLAQEDERIRQWHIRQQPAWWRWVMGLIGR